MGGAQNVEAVARHFLMTAVQEWGDADKAKVAAVQEVLDVAGFKAAATCFPVFGAIWPKPCEGTEAAEATAWLKELVDTMRRGNAHDEIAHIEAKIRERIKAKAGTEQA